MRKYQPIWEKLKTPPYRVEIAAPPQLHRRIIRMVMKEKDQDLGFKLLSYEQGKKFKLCPKSEQSKLTLTLTFPRFQITTGDL